MRPASPAPWLVLVSLLGLVAAGWSVRQARRDDLLARMWTAREAYAWVAPAAAATLALLVVPFVLGALISLYAHEEGTFTFAGLQNFLRILSARDSGFWAPRSFWYTLVITVVWTGLNVALHVAVGLGLALILREPWVRLRGMWRTLLIIPWAVPNYITALTWRGLFNFNYGAVNNLLAWLGVERVDWFSNFATSFAANLVTNTWLGFPFMMVVCLGALQAIPRDLEDAAEVDGATGWQRFRHVTWPLLQPALVPAMVLGTVWTFNMFNVIYLVSEGGPDSRTEILITEAYRWAFQRNEQYGLAAAYGVLIFGVLWVWGRFSGRWGQGPGTPGGRGGKP
jgi:arabinogalactan oligomer/maltooligosaccharide transport system permease protein